MIVLLSLIALWGTQAPAPAHCRITLAAAKTSERCQVRVPAGHSIRACADAERGGGHCAESGGARGRFVAWVVSTGPGRCRITDKGTKWKKGTVTAKLSHDKNAPAPSTCDLYVETQ